MKNALLVVPLLAVGVFAAGCASSSSSTTATGSAPTTVATTPAGTDQGASTAPSSPAVQTSPTVAGSSSASAGLAACTSSNLKVTLGGGAGAGMSQDHTGLNFTNTGSASCTLDGYPGVSWVAGDDGHQVGEAATRQKDPSGSAEQVITLAPGAVASAPIDIVDAAAFTQSVCKPVPVRGLRIYPPNETNAIFLPMATPAGGYGECSGTTPESSLTIGYLQLGTQTDD